MDNKEAKLAQRSVPEWANKSRATRLVYKGVRMLKNQGFAKTAFATKYVITRSIKMRKLIKGFYLSKEERIQQESRVFEYAPKISIIVPLFNTPSSFLRELIQ